MRELDNGGTVTLQELLVTSLALTDDLQRGCLFHFFRARTAGALKATRTMAIWI